MKCFPKIKKSYQRFQHVLLILCLLPQLACCFHFWLFKCQKCFNLWLVLTFYCETTWFSTHRCHAWARGNHKCVKGKHKWYQITRQKLKKPETFSFRVEQRGAFKLPPNQFSPDRRSESAERGEASGCKANFCCHFLEEASVGVKRCLWGGLVALCTTSPSLPPTGIWWQTRFNLPAMSSWVQLLIARCGGVTCLVRNEF